MGNRPRLPDNPRILGIAWDALRLPGMRRTIRRPTATIPGLYPATAALCQALATARRSLWVDQPENALLHQWCRRHTEALLVTTPDRADFTLVTNPAQMPSLYELNIGDGLDPATATTLLIQVPAMDARRELHWRPGGANAAPRKWTAALPATFWQQRQELLEMLPWGIDIFFIHDCSFVALPRDMAVPGVHAA